jgi:FAD/FMN-containing dehydrogenase
MLLVAGGGAVARVSDEETAFGQRTAPFNTHYLSMWESEDDDEKNIAYTRAIAGAMKPWTTGQVYLNYIGDEGMHRVESSFGEKKYARLQSIKAAWDPDNVFCHNQNIKPA